MMSVTLCDRGAAKLVCANALLIGLAMHGAMCSVHSTLVQHARAVVSVVLQEHSSSSAVQPHACCVVLWVLLSSVNAATHSIDSESTVRFTVCAGSIPVHIHAYTSAGTRVTADTCAPHLTARARTSSQLRNLGCINMFSSFDFKSCCGQSASAPPVVRMQASCNSAKQYLFPVTTMYSMLRFLGMINLCI